MPVKLAQATTIVAFLMLTLVGCAPGWGQSHFTIEDVLSNPDDTTVTNPENVTDTLCRGVSGCLEAWSTDEADYLRFDSNDEARTYLEALRDGYQSNRIVIDFTRTAPTPDIRRAVKEKIDGTHAST